MPQVGFKRMTPVFKWAKMVPALDRAATVIGYIYQWTLVIMNNNC
jgi:hypothetical protein